MEVFLEEVEVGSGYRCEPEGEAGAGQSQELEGMRGWQGHVRQLSSDRRRGGLELPKEQPTGPKPDTGSPPAAQRERTPLLAGGAWHGLGGAPHLRFTRCSFQVEMCDAPLVSFIMRERMAFSPISNI